MQKVYQIGRIALLGVIVERDPASNMYYVHEAVDENGNVFVFETKKEEPTSDRLLANDGSLDTVVNSSNSRIPQDNDGVKYSDRTETTLKSKNNCLRFDVENLRELLKLQGTVTGGNVFTADSLKTSANFILRETGMQLDADGKKTFEKLLWEAYGSLVGMDSESVTLEDILDTCSDAAEWLHSNSDDLEGDPLRKLDVNDMMVVIYDSLWKSMNLVL